VRPCLENDKFAQKYIRWKLESLVGQSEVAVTVVVLRGEVRGSKNKNHGRPCLETKYPLLFNPPGESEERSESTLRWFSSPSSPVPAPDRC